MLATSSRRSAPSAASGISQIAYQGTSHADATSSARVAHPAGATHPATSAAAPPGRPQEQRERDDEQPGERDARVVDDRPCRAARERRDAVGGTLREAPAAGAVLVVAQDTERLERAVPERDHSHDRDADSAPPPRRRRAPTGGAPR